MIPVQRYISFPESVPVPEDIIYMYYYSQFIYRYFIYISTEIMT